MIARIEVNLWGKQDYFKNDPQAFATLQNLFPSITDPSQLYSQEAIVDLDVVMPILQQLDLEPTIKAFKNTMFMGIREQIRHLESDNTLLRQQIARDGMAVQIHVPNAGLFMVSKVKVISDACTDFLQSELDEGWHILCVCPPNGQRRPDYILGK